MIGMASTPPTVVLVLGAVITRLDTDHGPWLNSPAELAEIIAGSLTE